MQHPHRHFLVLAILAAALIFPNLYRGGLSGYDDAFYAHEGKQMILTGDWWNVRFDGRLNFEYPPLFIWLEAISFKTFGVNDFAAKFPSALLGFGTILLVYFLALELTGQAWLSLLAMLVLMSTQFFVKYATHAMTDVPFTFFLTLVVFLYVKGLRMPVYLTLLGVPVGLGILTRSVIGLLPVAIIAAHLILTKRYNLLMSWRLGVGLALGVALPAVWFVSQYHLYGTAFLASHYRFIENKVTASSPFSLSLAVFEYPRAILKFYWPWLPFMLVGLGVEIRAVIPRRDSTGSLLVVWVLLILLPFSLVQTKYARYIMPVFPAFAMLSAIPLNRWIHGVQRSIFFKAACALILAVIFFATLFPAKVRAADMRALAPVADAHTLPGQRILIYTHGEKEYGFQNQFLWYGNRYSELVTDVRELASKLSGDEGTTVIIDKGSFGKVLRLASPEAARHLKILGQSEEFICFQVL